ncbi:DUF4920 domain-containing protein [Winogradskyella immobilis]|uniref:DUF4920 domain-containing protein n=1 Tax=Winogradskyella immobilis TaxID=2816852 RepID=A0ABS8ENC8_9FLAO|nr:DUF4920 domain-containing protein [Winogradskyella immobilis]MCC1484502.1 DUF4920 domain-containing protein [Winogradskyella immobilis]MCG0016594.1 DUF4920 domain-containing protein [Winogradskyella immobilis]
MKKIIRITIISIFVFSCNNTSKTVEINSETESVVQSIDEKSNQKLTYNSFGLKIDSKDVLPVEKMLSTYNTLKIGDTIATKMSGKISEVCSKKGCWMKLDMGNEQIVRVTFKDYGFFMPLDASGNVIVNGKAFVSETSVEDLKHYAEDAGKSVEEIAAIISPEKTYSFIADGVLLEE